MAAIAGLAMTPADAHAATVSQTDAAKTSVSASYELGSYCMSGNLVMTYAEASPSGTGAWERVETTELTPTKVTATGLAPGTQHDVKAHFRHVRQYDPSR